LESIDEPRVTHTLRQGLGRPCRHDAPGRPGAAGHRPASAARRFVPCNPQVARQTLEALRRVGIGISIDDYGSGFSSLSYLKTIPADELKVDKAFVLGLADDRTDQILICSVIDLAHSLGLQVVAEGVETEGALELLLSMGCDLAQGHLIAWPMPLVELEDFLCSRGCNSYLGAKRNIMSACQGHIAEAPTFDDLSAPSRMA
jgi:EAL domain